MFTATEAVPVAKVVAGNKRYPGVVALDNVNFTLNKGEVRALLGKNGAGKSTLIRMLTGSERPDSGDIWIGETRLEGDEATLTRRAAELGGRAVYQELSLVEGLTVAENLCLGQWPRRNGMIDYLQMAQDAQRCLQALGVDVSPEQLVSTLSPAQKQLVEIARVMKGEPRVVILDEPTSSLASAEVELVISAVKKMSALGVAVIYVSHRMEEIRRIASCATVMRDGQVAGDVMLENTSTHHIVSLMLGRDHVDIAPVAPQEIVDQAVLEVRALRHKPKLEDISFTLRRGEVLGIAGLLGAGRSELLKAIVGLETYEQGEIVINGEKITRPDYGDMLKRGIGYTPENRKEAGIIPWLGVDENTVLTNRQKISANGVLQWSTIRRLTEEVMQRMTVKAASSETPIGTLSGGNQQKVVIGRWVYAASQILLLDSLNAPGFISLNNQMNVLRDAATIGIAAWAMTLIIISGEIDVSVGPMVAFVSVCLAFLLQFEVPLAVACLLVLLLGALMGTLAGVLRGVFNVPSFVATLGLWSALRGMGLFMTNALPVPIDENEVLDWLGGQFLGVPVSALIMMVLFALFVFISRKTAFGRSVFAVGGNATAAQLCGINVRRVRILIFTLSGLLAAVTGILLAARLGSGNAGAANGLEFDVIAAVVVGGTALSGGRGSLFGTLLGVLVITLIGNGLVLLGINSFFQQVVRGVIIVVAVLANILLTQRSSKAKR
ncbi:TPA: ATP-binding cassette domain-containing protein [Escherichia coli]|nr:ATP-binding cassette domain-containing protein [Escherichia coli]HBK9460007.1 ATP-binding cassette domain-containing protein [Escherichia coli]HBK9493444.1 ATP-binding cassette domain-containing protein [Escherichia coli]HBK9565681.1 ATP-binding cassette domain-containing protein [Escherichia coli]HBK9621125.1 ATP-binding cassette domain-containing protein [Escherichia coli]